MANKKTTTAKKNPAVSEESATSLEGSASTTGSNGNGLGTTRLLEVLTAFRKGDFSQRMPVDQTGVEGKICDTLNDIIDLGQSQVNEVNRIAEVVGREGRLTQRAAAGNLTGSWADSINAVNTLIDDLVQPTTEVARVISAVASGDLTQKMALEIEGRPVVGEFLQAANNLNTMVDQLRTFAGEVTRVAREVGTEGKLGGQAVVEGVSGTWLDLTNNVNTMASNLTDQVRNIAQVTTAVANGDLSKKITVEVRGEVDDLKNTINTMVDQLSAFAGEVTRVAQEVGTDGKLGGQAVVEGVSGTWLDLTDNVNTMAGNLTDQVRGIAKVVTGVANGDLTQEVRLEARGEVGELVDVINGMIRTLSTFAEQVTGVARDVGIEGVLGGRAEVPGAEGTWRDLTDNVNELAGNLTTQVRAIADVSTAVAEGDLTRTIDVEARGEVAALADNINRMIGTLAETSQTNTDQDWLKTGLATLTRVTTGASDLKAVTEQILQELAPMISAQHAVMYMAETTDSQPTQLVLSSTYAFKERKNLSNVFQLGEGLVGQCAIEKRRIVLTDVPSDYIQISSGLGEATPMNIAVLPVLFENELLAVIELASFTRYSEIQIDFMEQLSEALGIGFNAISATQRNEELLEESQTLTEELQTQQEELQQTNEELEEKGRLVEDQKQDVERKNEQVEAAKADIEEKARQLELTSRYKSEFLANMSHELRTPLNSLLILSKMLADNPEENLTAKQVEYAGTIHGSGADLLNLINEILDLSKIESGIMAVESQDVPFADIKDDTERNFHQVADEKKLSFAIDLDAALPATILTDPNRLLQVLKNLLSNAFKFTDEGEVALRMAPATSGWTADNDSLNRAASVVAFAVSDTGVGIPEDKQMVIFEAFQQADGGTSRKHGGTGLGLSISREIARLLGGEIRLISRPGQGSTFTFYVPLRYTPPTPGTGGASTPGATGTVGTATGTVGNVLRDVPSGGEDGGTAQRPLPTGDGETATAEDAPLPAGIADDRNNIQPGDRVVLLLEDDVNFARILLDMAHKQEFKALVALTGDTALALARQFKPDAISLDIRLPDMDGWQVLDRLKHDPDLRHIPVHIISAVEEGLERGLRQGAVACFQKPIDQEKLSEVFANMEQFLERKVKELLIVEDDEDQRKALTELIGNSDVHSTAVGTGEQALAALADAAFECMVLDLGLPDMSGFDLIEKIHKDLGLTQLPIIVYTGKELTQEEETRLKAVTETIIVKDVRSPERLLDETALFLHRVHANLPEDRRKMIKQLHETDPALAGQKVLIVDDDVRNIFALTSVLERHKMQVVYSESGKDGIDKLRSTPDIGIVLMDIMMPGMDGYETTGTIRRDPKFKRLPIIALTAKAMKGDREKCIDAGASDYITKPVDTEQLLSLLRVWLHK